LSPDRQAGDATNGDHVGTLFRLFGDVNGDGVVDNLDCYQLRSSLGKPGESGYPAALDDHGDGTIDSVTDVAEFARRKRKRRGA
jgi:hypothetical protein